MADDVADVLDPNDDGLHAEYILTVGTNGTQLIISIPHFSIHEISILSLKDVVEKISSTNGVLIYVLFSLAILVAAVFHLKRFWR